MMDRPFTTRRFRKCLRQHSFNAVVGLTIIFWQVTLGSLSNKLAATRGPIVDVPFADRGCSFSAKVHTSADFVLFRTAGITRRTPHHLL